ncbi:MAG: sensor histidine kinase KdpD, partial [Anaerolineales bacterium]|nr:sensor histidine kinase KdpD [Anaerolineales bacterium]
MSEPVRPSPDALLAHAQAEARRQARGRLKIFLGYAAGVGKTYAMLEAARQRQAEGLDVVVAYVETHGRADTEALLAGLELVPRRQVDYRGARLPELDLDAVLARRPQLALVDELAHTNAPGSRHPKRYQDVEELLAAGLNVYTTLNIQHLDSLNDVVAQITGVVVRETVPDRVLDEAGEIELVDLPPGELIQRLKEGKVYVPDQAARAIQKFFRQGNLTALREMALRRAAERVDDQMRAYMQTRAIPGPWSASERLLVCVGPGRLSERLVRAARRLADELNAEWFAAHVELPAGLEAAEREGVARVLLLAEELGARSVTLPGRDVAEAALAYARQHNVTNIIVGQPLRPRWQEWLFGSVVDRLIRRSGPIDVYVISGQAQPGAQARREWWPHAPFARYGQSLGLVALATLVGFGLDPGLSGQKWALAQQVLAAGHRPADFTFTEPALEPTNLVMVYLAAVVIAALSLGRGPALLASGLSVLAFDYFFVPPYLTFAVSDTQYVLTFVAFFTVGLTISTLAARTREQAEAAGRRAAETAELLDLSRDLAAAASPDAIALTSLAHVQQTFGREAIILLANGDRLEPHSAAAGFQMDENEMAVADWVYRNGEPAGRNTQTLTAARLRYLPLKTARGRLGVLGVKGPEDGRHLTPEQRRLMEAFASQAAQAFERASLAEAARQAAMLQATEKLQTALLNSISHDLRTPLVSITGALSTLQEAGLALDEAARRALVDNARDEAERLNRLVGNLLEMTRLESGALRLRREPADIQDLIGAALDQLGPRAASRPMTVTVPAGLPLAPLDFVVMVQVLVNLLDNALKYSPPEAPVEVRASAAADSLLIEVADRGVGLPPD